MAEENAAEVTAPKLPAHLRDDLKFQPGQSGNPAGRPKGARSKFGEAFVQDILADWEEHGAATIVKVRGEDPIAYLKVCASIVPKELSLKVNDDDGLSDDQLLRQLANVYAGLAARGVALDAVVRSPAAPQPTGDVSPLH